jgi:hypothetical protein
LCPQFESGRSHQKNFIALRARKICCIFPDSNWIARRASSVKRNHAQMLASSMVEWKRTKSAVWEQATKLSGGKPLFLSQMNIQPIIVGTEMEYGIPEQPPVTRNMILSNLPEGLVFAGEFLSNGARFYVDMHHKAEYAAPECLTVEDTVHSEFSGEKIVFYALSRLMEKEKIERYPIRKCVTDDDGRTWGYHENYLISRELYNSQNHLPFLMGHFATQSVLTGAGRIVITEDKKVVVQPAQKMHGISQVASCNSTTNKALINQRDRPYCDSERWARQHVVCNDANLTVSISQLKIGSTKLALRLGEFSERFDFIKKQDIKPRKPLDAALLVSSDHKGAALLNMVNGKAMTALNVQEELLRQAILLSNEVELPADEQSALAHWQRMHDVAKYDPDKADEIIEHRAKRAFIKPYVERIKQKGRVISPIVFTKINHAWDNLDPALGIGRKWLNGADHGLLDADYIDHLVISPPTGTRAYDRAQFISRHKAPGTPPIATDVMTWEGGNIGETRVQFKNPFGSDTSIWQG